LAIADFHSIQSAHSRSQEMKIIEAESSDQRIVLQAQKFNEFRIMEDAIFLLFFTSIAAGGYQESKSLKMPIFVILAYVITIPFTLFRWRSKGIIDEPLQYVLDRENNAIFKITKKTIVSAAETQNLAPLTDVQGFYLKTFMGEPSRDEDGYLMLSTTFHYEVVMKLASAEQVTIENSSISVRDREAAQKEFRELIVQTEAAIRQLGDFLDVSRQKEP
jgi:hypothetical protein